MSIYQQLVGKVSGLDFQHTVALIAVSFLGYEFIKQGFWAGLASMAYVSQMTALGDIAVIAAAIAAISGAYFSAKTPVLSVQGGPTAETVSQSATSQTITPKQ